MQTGIRVSLLRFFKPCKFVIFLGIRHLLRAYSIASNILTDMLAELLANVQARIPEQAG